MNHIELRGCTSEPLSSYLTGLAVLRLVSEQRDPDARGWWDRGVFQLESNVNVEDLLKFFLNEYIPSPIVSPWSHGSGFYEGDNTDGMDAIMQSKSERFALYRETIQRVRSFPEMPPTGRTLGEMLTMLNGEAMGKGGKIRDLVSETRGNVDLVTLILHPESPLNLTVEELEERMKLHKISSLVEKERVRTIQSLIRSAKKVRTEFKKISQYSEKEQIIQACRDRLDERVVDWIDAAVVIGPDGNAKYPPILGTGGNEGRFEYSNGFMKNMASMLISEDVESSCSLLRNALFGDPTNELKDNPVGQYDPGRAGGFNQGYGFKRENFPTNPWSIVLTMEGTIPWASSVARRQGMFDSGFLRSPFTVRASPVGYASSCDKDDMNARAEIWAPLWNHPSGYREIRSFLSEGRADVGRRPALNGIEFAEAASSLGVDRGVSEFVRYTLLKRRGDSYVALPAGRFLVRARTETDLVRELDPLLRRVNAFLRGFKGDGPPARFSAARRDVDKAIYNLLIHGGSTYVKYLVAAIGRLEKLIDQREPEREPKINRPISGLSPRWIAAADDGSIEIRIAAALASIGATGDVGPIRANLSQVDPKTPWTWGDGRGQTSWEGNSLPARLTSILSRRMMDARMSGAPSNPLWGAIPLTLEDASTLIEGDVDEALVEDLLFGFTWIRWDNRDAVRAVRQDLWLRKGWRRPIDEWSVPRSWAMLKLLFLPGPIKAGDDEITIKPEPSIIALLRAGRVHDACAIAGRRLSSTGLRPLTTDFTDGSDGVRIAAALLLPIQNGQQLMRLVLRPREKKI